MDKLEHDVKRLAYVGRRWYERIMTGINELAKTLDAALKRLESNMEVVFDRVGDPGVIRREVEALTEDRGRLAEELDASLAREKELQTLADEASVALGSAIAEVRAALERQGET